MNLILNEHAPLKWVNKYKLKLKSKHWITPAIQKSASVKNNLLKKIHYFKRSTNKGNIL